MPEPPELVSPTATPADILQRLELMREQYRMGLMDAASFNHVLELFQFPDVTGVLWTPGAQSGRWYQWNGREWVPGNPPERLQIPQMPLELAPETERPAGQAAPAEPEGPRPVPCPKCGASNVAKKFCTTCGTKLASG